VIKNIMVFVLLAMFVLALPVLAAPEESVEVRVTPSLVSVSLSESTLDFGAVGLDQEEEHPTAVVATNNGSVDEDLEIKGSDAEYSGTPSNTWALSDSDNGADQFMLKVSKDSGWTDVINLSNSYKDFQSNLAVDAGQSFRTKILMPTSTSVYGEHTARIYVLATEH